MKILHTSDWHLGQKFMNNHRAEEHQLALNWLVALIQKEKIDTFILAGDVFDIGNPPSYARRLYYDFLKKMMATTCRHIIITGGNHDSPAMLNAPKDLLEAFNINIIGSATEDLSDEIIELKDKSGKIEAVIAAVPFLRERDLRYSVAGESGAVRAKNLRKAIGQHYHDLADLMKPYAKKKIPLLTTGHLYAVGAKTAAKQDNIYIGNLENISAAEFPTLFDYVALGHIHRPQNIGKKTHIRYSGSIIPLSFSEIKDDKSIVVLDFSGKKLKSTNIIKVPLFRRLKSIKGDIQKIKESLQKLDIEQKDKLKPWVEIIIQADEITPRIDIDIRTFAAEMHLDILRIKVSRKTNALEKGLEEHIELDNLDEVDVFKKKCESSGVPKTEMATYMDTFLELKDWMLEQND